MKTTIDYSKSPCAAFDAMQDVMNYFGDKWGNISPEMAKVTDQKEFTLYAALLGVCGFPVIAWYEHYYGEGSWKIKD